MFLKVFDEFLDDTTDGQLYFLVQDKSYNVIRPDGIYGSIGSVCDLEKDDEIVKVFKHRFEQQQEIKEAIDGMVLHRALINNYAPLEQANYHIDLEGGITLIYFVNKKYNLEHGGETSFYMPEDDMVIGIPPRQQRLVMFDGGILHRATTFRDKRRFNIVFQYGPEFEC